jgi:hypothetical protein
LLIITFLNELRAKARARYHANHDLSRAKVLDSYYRNPPNPVTRKNWRNKNREAINANRRAYYALHREHILVQQKETYEIKKQNPDWLNQRRLISKLTRLHKLKETE